MKISKNYVNYLMKNYPSNSDSISTIDSINFNQSGGKIDTINHPNGGFPPIHLCNQGESEELFTEEDKPKREFSTHQTSVSIKDIMEKRRKTTPFISL